MVVHITILVFLCQFDEPIVFEVTEDEKNLVDLWSGVPIEEESVLYLFCDFLFFELFGWFLLLSLFCLLLDFFLDFDFVLVDSYLFIDFFQVA